MRFAARLALACLCAVAAARMAGAQGSEPTDFAAALDRSRAEQVDVLAPTAFAQAAQAYETALKDRARGRDPERVRARLQQAEAALKRAELAAAGARQSLSGLIETYQDALDAKAPKYAPEDWAKAQERFAQAMRENERGELRNAQRRAAEAEVLLREAELTAIKNEVLGDSRALISQAEEARVERHAPRTLLAARRHLADAEQEIQRNRYDLVLPRGLAAQASYEASHALYLADLIRRTLEAEKGGGGLEALILSWEEPLTRMAQNMEIGVQFDRGFQTPLRELNEQVQQQAQEIRRLKLELEDREQRIGSLNAQIERLDARLGGVSQERIALQRRVDAQERLRSNVARLAASFTPDEARVERQGDDVLVSLLGIGFPPGRSTIGADSAALMEKVRSALELFPQAVITVEGHTDASGGDSANLILSQDRADAVKQYLVTHFGLDPEKVSSIGYGEARPVATNETTAGRARNRRIDLLIRP